MASKNKLSIYLMKKEITNISDILKDFDKVTEFKKYGENSIAYCMRSYVHEPTWVQSFFRENGKDLIKQSNAKLVLIKKNQY